MGYGRAHGRENRGRGADEGGVGNSLLDVFEGGGVFVGMPEFLDRKKKKSWPKVGGGPTGGPLGVREGPRAVRLEYGRAHGRPFGAKVGGGPTGGKVESRRRAHGRPAWRYGRAHGRTFWSQSRWRAHGHLPKTLLKSEEGPRAACFGVRGGPTGGCPKKVPSLRRAHGRTFGAKVGGGPTGGCEKRSARNPQV